MEFKVGDKVRFIGAENEYYTQFSVYEVVDCDEGNDLCTLKLGEGIDVWHTKDVRKCFRRIDEPQADQSEPQPQVTKVKLTQEQARALENAMKDSDIEYVITAHATAGEWVPDEKRALNELSVADLARALLIGYEVEQTAEEKVLSELQAAFDDEDYGEVEYTCYTDGVRMVLNAYGIKVKGIND